MGTTRPAPKARRPPNVDGYDDDLLALFDKAFSQQFIRTKHRRLIIHAAAPSQILDQFDHYQPPTVQKWLEPNEI